MPMARFLSLVLALVIVLTSGVQPLSAQGIVPPIDPIFPPIPSPDLPRPPQITLAQHHVDVTVDGPVAQVTVTQLFRNLSATAAEGLFLFPLPADAAPTDFQMTVDGQVLEGQVLDREEARSIYDAIVRRNLDPALLEYVGQGLFRTNVFPVPAGAERTLTFTYRQVLSRSDGLFHFVYPLRTRQFSAAPVESLSVAVTLVNQPGLRTIYSPSHTVSIDRSGEDRATIGFEAAGVQPEQDFQLYFGTDESAVGLNLLSYAPAGEEGFFLLLAAPGVDVADDEIVQRDLVLVLDTSGSMQGEKMAQAQAAARYVITHLNPGDRFNLIYFSTGVSLWRGQPQPVNPANTDAALAWIDDLVAAGSTDINRALLEALAQLDPSAADSADPGQADRPGTLLFLTDGLPTQGLTDPDQIRRTVLQGVPADRDLRLFTFGVGYDVNTDLLDSLSADLGGRSAYVTQDERIDEKVSGFYAGISTPILAQVSVTVQDEAGQPVALNDSYPFPLPDLFAGEQLVVAGRYAPAAGGAVTVTLSGTVNGRAVRFDYGERQLATAGGEFFVARLWATRKIGALLDQIRLEGPKAELVDALVDLSLTYGIVTPYTSYLVLEPDLALEGRPPFQTEMELAPRGMGGGAADSVGMAAAAAAEAPAVGAEAVAASKVRTDLRYAQQAAEARTVRFVAGRTFVDQGQVATPDGGVATFWVDSLFDESMPTETVVFGTPRYAELAAEPSLRPWLALSSELVLVVDDAALRITAAGAQTDAPILGEEMSSAGSARSTPTATATSLPTPTATPAPDNAAQPSRWAQFWSWVRDLVE